MNSTHSTSKSSVLPLFAGVDVGGTNVKIGVASDAGEIVAESQFPTEQSRGPQYAIQTAVAELKRLVDQVGLEFSDVVAAGLGTPGTMDIPNGMILEPSNLPGWRHFNVRDALTDEIGRPVVYSNDATAAAYGEFWSGRGSGFSSMVLFTLGTGVGGGIILGDHWVDGAHSHGSEVGHVVVDTSPDARQCGCGQLGHLEAYTSATGLVARAREKAATGVDTLLKDHENLTALEVSNLASAGDQVAIGLVMETADYLARGIATLAHVIDPEVFLLGGAMNFGGNESELGRQFLGRITERVSGWTFPTIAKHLKIDYAKLGSAAGWVGAAGLGRIDYYKNHSTSNNQAAV